MNDTPSFIINPSSHITIAFTDGKSATIYSGDAEFGNLITAIKQSDWEEARNIVFRPIEEVSTAVELMSEVEGDVVIEHGVVFVDGRAIHNTIADRIIAMNYDGFNITPMKLFLKNLMQNPSFRAVEELYDFLEATQLPITDDGHFLAYKKIRDDYTDQHTGKMDNSIGATVSMPRNQVNDNKDQTCSSGLHFCGRSYLSSFSGARTVVVKVNPRDVVSIPSDYNNAKGRACKYIIWQELDIDDVSRQPTVEIEKKTVAVPVPSIVTIQSIDPRTNEVVGTYDTVEQAADAVGVSVESIHHVLKGTWFNTAGLMWKYCDTPSTDYDLADEPDICLYCEEETDWCCCDEPDTELDDEDEDDTELDDEDDTWEPSTLDELRTGNMNSTRRSDYT